MKIGAMELIVIFIVALLVIGPDKLPSYARKFGSAMKAFREASSDLTQEFRESVVDPLEEAQKPLREAMEPLEEINKEIRDNVKGVERDLNSIGKKKKDSKEPEKKDTDAAGEAVPEEAPAEPTPEAAAPVEETESSENAKADVAAEENAE